MAAIEHDVLTPDDVSRLGYTVQVLREGKHTSEHGSPAPHRRVDGPDRPRLYPARKAAMLQPVEALRQE